MSVRTPLRWAGGKTKLIPELVKHVPSNFERYIEPFAGGAALFFHLQPLRARLSDANPDLVNFYLFLQSDVVGMLERLWQHESDYTKDPAGHFHSTRFKFNEEADPYLDADRAADFKFLNATCFNGLWRVNSKGSFNVPFGKLKNPSICNSQRLIDASKTLQAAELWTGDFEAAIQDVRAGDLIYFDPPYHPVSDTANFTSYTTDGFERDEQIRLGGVAHDAVRRGAHVIISNSDTPLIREIYRGWELHEVQAPRRINSDGAKRGNVDELIIIGKQAS